jgi:hypothetical protein
MANKGSILYDSYIELLAELSTLEKGELFETMLEYQRTGNVGELSANVKVIFPFIKRDIDLNKKKYEKVCEKRKENIKKRWDADTKNTNVENESEKNTNVKSDDTKNTNVYKCIFPPVMALQCKEKEKEKEKENTTTTQTCANEISKDAQETPNTLADCPCVNSTDLTAETAKDVPKPKFSREVIEKADYLMDLWNDFCITHPSMSKVVKMTNGRRKRIKTRLTSNSNFIDEIKTALSLVDGQPFALGDSKGGWSIDFDWLIEDDTNYVKLLEGKYKNKKPTINDKLAKSVMNKYQQWTAEQAGKLQNEVENE